MHICSLIWSPGPIMRATATFGAAMLLNLSAHSRAAPPAPKAPLPPAGVDRIAFDACVQANARSEFDTTADILSRIKSVCVLKGTVTFKARGDALHGDLLAYDPEAQTASWKIDISTARNGMYGTNISPFNPILRPADRARLSEDDLVTLDRFGNSAFWFMDIASADKPGATYRGQNGFGASFDVLKIRNVRYAVSIPVKRAGLNVTVLTLPLPSAQARALMPFLDIEIDWAATPLCAVCFTGGEVAREDYTPITMSHPIDKQTSYRYVFGAIKGARLVDRRTRQVIQVVPGTSLLQ